MRPPTRPTPIATGSVPAKARLAVPRADPADGASFRCLPPLAPLPQAAERKPHDRANTPDWQPSRLKPAARPVRGRRAVSPPGGSLDPGRSCAAQSAALAARRLAVPLALGAAPLPPKT